MAVDEINDSASWEAEVLRSHVPVMADFWAEWCGPCRAVAPVVDELSRVYEGRVKFVKVNVDRAGDLAQRYGVFSIPTLMIFKGGEKAAEQVGSASKQAIHEMIERVVAPA